MKSRINVITSACKECGEYFKHSNRKCIFCSDECRTGRNSKDKIIKKNILKKENHWSFWRVVDSRKTKKGVTRRRVSPEGEKITTIETIK